MDNLLFNEKTVKKLVSDIKVSTKQKNAVNKWMEYLNNNKLENEKEAYIEFANIILKDLLDYDISLTGLKHEEQNIEFLFKINGKNLICFEAKGTKTKNLWAYQGREKKSRETPVNQINSYMYEKKIPYGILTNYRLFVLFDRNEGNKKYHIIDFTELTKEEKLKEFIAFFSREKVESGLITDVIQQSIVEEREFTKEFYKLYHETRLMLIKEFEENSGISREASVHFAQLYLNRLMFVFFAEDTGKIEKRIIEDRIINTLDNIHSFSNNSFNVSSILVALFNDLDKGSDFPIKLFGFNGGLFRHPIPPKIFFKDFRDEKFFKSENKYSKLKKKELELNPIEKEVFDKYKNRLNPIIKNILLMDSFDFNTEVNVNILGHIFEQSISDIEELKTNKSSRRKKEGIFYTPKYITDYICRNTIIPYLSNKGVNDVPKLIKEYSDNIEELEKKFKSIRILDPACGSGAFLIKATDIMLDIFKAIQEFKQSEKEYEAKKGTGIKAWQKRGIKESTFTLSKWNEEDEAREIIENSIHGVDINEESVEITKLSLFLKMARKNRKLTDLSNNIKKGNSLISDTEVAGELAFDWDKEFPFKFDVVIGNPPYVLCQPSNTEEKTLEYYKKKYASASYKIDLFHLFIEKSILVLNSTGSLGLITPNTYLTNKYISRLREYILDNTSVKTLILFEEGVFEDASVDTSILISKKPKEKSNKIMIQRMNNKGSLTSLNEVKQTNWEDEEHKTFNIKGGSDNNFSNCTSLGDIASVTFGLQTKDKSKYVSTIKHDAIWENCYTGRNIERYFLFPSQLYFKNKINEVKAGGSWDMNIHHSKKIVVRQVGNPEPIFAFDSNGFASLNTMYNIVINDNLFNEKYVLAVLNSKLIKKYWLDNFCDNKKIFPKIKGFQLKQIPIPKIPLSEQKSFIEKVDLLLKLNKEFYNKKNKFLTIIKHECKIEKITKKLDKFYELECESFMNQLKIKLSIDKKSEILDFFEKYKKDLLNLKNEIEKTDNEINQMVYKLYSLTYSEIKTVEGCLK